MLKVFFGADPAPLARAALAHHEGLLSYFEALRERRGADIQPGQKLALDTGIDYHRWWCDQWRRLRSAAGER